MNGCVEWDGPRNKGGYGWELVGRRKWLAHRLAWIDANGRPIPEGMVVCHHCDNPPCVNPEHLFLGTLRDNNQDRHAKGGYEYMRGAGNVMNRYPERRPRGEQNGFAKLNAAIVLEVRRLHAEGASLRSLARRFSVDPVTIRMVVRRVTWRHV